MDGEVIITCVSDSPDVEQVILGEAGIIHSAQPGTIVIDMSTVSPTVTRQIWGELCPALSKFMAMGAPIVPIPIKAIFILPPFAQSCISFW